MSEIKRFLSDAPARKDNLGTCKKTAESLLSFVLDSEGIPPPFIIGLFGPWGSGKSTVLNSLENKAEQSDEVISIQIDAWKKSKESFLRDFLRVVASKLYEKGLITGKKKDNLIEKITKKQVDQTTTWELKSHVKRVLIYLVISFAIFLPGAWAISYLMQWYDLITLATFPPSWVLQFALAGMVTFIVHLIVTEGKVQNASTSEPTDMSDPFRFREIFSELIGFVSAKEKTLCISIDNLDRCDPDEAIEIMRRIKTFMIDDKDKPPLAFIVACDDKALEKHLRRCFKQERIAAREFLRKFFNISVKIPGIHPSDMHEFIDSQLKEVFPDGSLIPISQDQKQHMRNIIFAAFAKTPRQVKQFINQLAAKLYILRDIENQGALSIVKPSESPEVVALYLAACNATGQTGFYSLDELSAGIARKDATSNMEEELGKLHNLHLHSKIDRTLWAAIEQMKDPSNRQRWGNFADMYHSIEVGHSRDFKSGLNDVDSEGRHELIDDLFSECTYRNNDDAKKNLIRFILNARVVENVAPSRQIAAHLLSYIQTADVKISWDGWDGNALAHYVIKYKDILRQIIDRVLQQGQISDETINTKTFIGFLSNAIGSINASQLAEIWTRSLEHVPQAVELMANRTDSIKTEHIQKLSGLWQNNLKHIVSLMQNSQLPKDLKHTLIESALGWSFEAALTDPQDIKITLQKDGHAFMLVLIKSLSEVNKPDITHIRLMTTALINHLGNIPDESVKLQVLDILGLILDIEARNSLQILDPNFKANLPNVLWNEVSRIEPNSLIKLFRDRSSLLDVIAQPNKPALAMRSLELYDFLMINDAIPNGWYSALIEQSYPGQNMFAQWIEKYWQDLNAEYKSKVHMYLLQRAQQPGVVQRELPQLKMHLQKMDISDSDELLNQRYDFIVKTHPHLIAPNQINTAAGLEALLQNIDELTGMKGIIPDNLKQIVKSARDVVPHNDLSPHAKGLKIRWGRALKRG